MTDIASSESGRLPCPRRGTVTYHWISRSQQIMLFWVDGQVKACSAICPHMGARLEADPRRRIVTCPWHGLTAKIGSSEVEGFSCAHPRYRRIKQYRVTRDDNGHITLER